MNINYDCVAIWVGKAGRTSLLQLLEEWFGFKNVSTSSIYTQRTSALFVYKGKSTLFRSKTIANFQDLEDYMYNKKLVGEVESYTVIDYPKLVKECREWTYDY